MVEIHSDLNCLSEFHPSFCKASDLGLEGYTSILLDRIHKLHGH